MPSLDIPVDTLILPGLNGSANDHWQRHWARDNPESRVVEQFDWTCPDRQSWLVQLERQVDMIGKDIWLVGHSLGCVLAAQFAESPLASRIRGALLVAPCDLDTTETLHPCVVRFGAMPAKRLPFPSLVVGSLNDPYMPVDRLRQSARAWGSDLVDIGNAGHINIERLRPLDGGLRFPRAAEGAGGARSLRRNAGRPPVHGGRREHGAGAQLSAGIALSGARPRAPGAARSAAR